MARSYDVREEYLGAGNLDEYDFDFKIEALGHLLVVVVDDDGVEVSRAYGTASSYVASVEFDAVAGGGTVTLNADLPTGYTLILLLANDEPIQAYEFKNKFDFTLKRIESALDYVTGPIQRLSYLAKRSVKLHDLDDPDDFDPTLPPGLADSPGCILALNLAGDGLRVGPTVEVVETWKNDAQAAAVAAAASAASAASSGSAASGSATDSANAAAASAAQALEAADEATAAAASANAAADSVTDAAQSATDAEAARDLAQGYASDASDSAIAAAASAQDAQDLVDSVSSIADEVTAVETARDLAQGYASDASDSADAAAASAGSIDTGRIDDIEAAATALESRVDDTETDIVALETEVVAMTDFVTAITSNTTLATTYSKVPVNTTSGDITITLPASPSRHQEYTVYKTVDANLVTVSASSTSYYLVYAGDSLRFAWNGSTWIRLSKFWIPKFVSAVSSEFRLDGTSPTGTGFVTGCYPQLVNSAVALRARASWTIHSMVYLRDLGTDPVVTEILTRWSIANGNNTSTAPTAATVDAGSYTLLAHYVPSVRETVIHANTIRVSPTSDLSIYMNPRMGFSSAGDGAIAVATYAERVG